MPGSRTDETAGPHRVRWRSLFPAAAFAHATLRSTTPHFGKELKGSPGTIRLHFDQEVRIVPGRSRCSSTTGKNYAGAVHTTKTDIIAAVRPLPRGAYTVRWHAISADSHVVSGRLDVRGRRSCGADQRGLRRGRPDDDRATSCAGCGSCRWRSTIGSLGFRLICLRGLDVPLALERKLAVAAGIGVVASLQVGIAAFSLRAEDACSSRSASSSTAICRR